MRIDDYSHWHDFSSHPVEDWQYEVANGDTRLGYKDWVKARLDETGDGFDGHVDAAGDPIEVYAHSPERCPSKHWNGGDDICEDCGLELNA